ncbi:Beta-soluble NSF attachment protein [Hypsibius exemplaris]|uniref:Beta-soluble NSF attachment protein n=1 Tax=Hypsibius exemplaris TaxID=2072580 RepID=A0A1W0WML5_HYPEX|nr:Beta-soluble NSF attachment protein [Hypsibius exemplaris]
MRHGKADDETECLFKVGTLPVPFKSPSKMASAEEQQAQKLMAEADKKSASATKTTGFISGVFGGSSSGKIDDAIELYCKAANIFKMAKNWSDSGTCSLKAAHLYQRINNKLEAFSKFTDASNAFKKNDPQKAIECLKQAVAIQTEMGRFSMAAKTLVSMAEICEAEPLRDIPQAVGYYEKATDYYQGEESKSQAQPCMLKVAQYAAEREEYGKAIEIFEQVAERCAANPMLKSGAKEYFFKASLCQLSVDPLNAGQALARYIGTCPAFQDTREYKLMKALLGALDGDPDGDAFDAALKAYDEVGRMDGWAAGMLQRVKRRMGGDSDLT